MDPTHKINRRVSVVAVFRRQGHQPEICQPVKMLDQGREVVFSELGLRHPTSAGKRMIHVFDMSDGSNDYRLEFDAVALTWTLVEMIEGTDVRD
jgi:hypothetical protein